MQSLLTLLLMLAFTFGSLLVFLGGIIYLVYNYLKRRGGR